jgi:hypothetical protein
MVFGRWLTLPLKLVGSHRIGEHIGGRSRDRLA